MGKRVQFLLLNNNSVWKSYCESCLPGAFDWERAWRKRARRISIKSKILLILKRLLEKLPAWNIFSISFINYYASMVYKIKFTASISNATCNSELKILGILRKLLEISCIFNQIFIGFFFSIFPKWILIENFADFIAHLLLAESAFN